MAAQAIDLLLGELTDAAEAQWSDFRLDRSAFAKRLMAAVEDEDGDPAVMLRRVHVVDLYLAFACEQRIPAALGAFAAMYLSSTDQYLRPLGNSGVRAEDVRRELEDTLLFGRTKAPSRIGQYRGHGPLRSFVTTVARNIALTMLRPRRENLISDFTGLASQLSAPIESLRGNSTARYETIVHDAVRSALLALDRRQRTIVRLHLVRGATFTQIGRMLKVHQSTVSRSFEAALRTLYARIRHDLRDLHGLSDSEMRSIIRDVRSRIDVTWSRISREVRRDVTP
jgi:RNA polymerase sigma-70 factor